MDIRYITKDEQYRYTGGQSNEFAGNFCHTGHHGVYELVDLDEFDKGFTAGVVLKPGEKLFRFKTRNTRIAGVKPLVKINLERGLVYFLVEGAETPEFEKRGLKIRYMNLVKN